MKNKLFKQITYQGTDGKRKARNFVIAGALILGGLIFLAEGSNWFSNQSRLMIQATPRPIIGPTFTPTSPIPTVESSSVNASASCQDDSAEWDLVDVFQNNNYQGIDPLCVYSGLNKPLAWLLAAQGAGYTNPEALKILGYRNDVPYDNSLPQIDLLPPQGRIPESVTTSWSPLYKDYRDWYIAGDAVISETFTLTGCYRTYDLVGNQAQFWSSQWSESGATYICEIAQDRPVGWDISAINGLIYSKQSAAPSRQFAYFVYDNRPQYRSWYFVGYGASIEMTALSMQQAQSDTQKFYHSPVWDLSWLEKTYGIFPQAAPQNWEQHTSRDDFNKILSILNQ